MRVDFPPSYVCLLAVLVCTHCSLLIPASLRGYLNPTSLCGHHFCRRLSPFHLGDVGFDTLFTRSPPTHRPPFVTEPLHAWKIIGASCVSCHAMQVLLDGVPMYSASNIPAQAYTQYSVSYTTKSTSMTFAVLGRDDPGALYVDDVSICECGHSACMPFMLRDSTCMPCMFFNFR